MLFNNRINCEYYYNNCIYNYIKAGQVSDFKVYNITTKLGIIYIYIIEYFNLLLFSECQRVLAANLIKDL